MTEDAKQRVGWRFATDETTLKCVSVAIVTCRDCGVLLSAEGSQAPAEGEPCPQCGSTVRNETLMVSVGEHVRVGESAQAAVLEYARVLLQEVEELIKQRKFSLGIIVAHMACEVAVERSLTTAFARRKIDDLAEPIAGFLNGYNLANERLRNLYTALTGDAIEDEPFWPGFKDSAKLRNLIVHKGRIATESDARESLQAATAFVERVSVPFSDLDLGGG